MDSQIAKFSQGVPVISCSQELDGWTYVKQKT